MRDSKCLQVAASPPCLPFSAKHYLMKVISETLIQTQTQQLSQMVLLNIVWIKISFFKGRVFNHTIDLFQVFNLVIFI